MSLCLDEREDDDEDDLPFEEDDLWRDLEDEDDDPFELRWERCDDDEDDGFDEEPGPLFEEELELPVFEELLELRFELREDPGANAYSTSNSEVNFKLDYPWGTLRRTPNGQVAFNHKRELYRDGEKKRE